MTAGQATDRLLRHRVRLEGVARSEMRILYQALKGVADSVEDKLLRAEKGPWKGVTEREHKLWKQRLDAVKIQIDELAGEAERQIWGKLKRQSQELVEMEAGILESVWANVDGMSLGGIRITPELVGAAIDTPVGGYLLEDYVTRAFSSEAWRIKRAIQQAALSGEGPAKAARLMRADVAKIGKRDAMTLARTHLNTISNRVNEEFLDQNDVDRVMYIDTLDARTCLQCAAESGKTYRRSDKRPPTPQHPNCRCLYVPFVEGLEPRKRNYESWLRTQPEAFQKETLGPKRWDAWQEKNIPISGMVYEGKVRTVKELQVIFD